MYCVLQFCQPHGWEIVTKPQSPYFIPFVLTSETGTRLYCVSLNFYQQYRHASPEINVATDQDVAMVTAPPVPQHRRLVETHSVVSNVSVVGDDLDMQWDIDMIDGGVSSPKLEFEPVSLCAISVHPLFSTLKVMHYFTLCNINCRSIEDQECIVFIQPST